MSSEAAGRGGEGDAGAEAGGAEAAVGIETDAVGRNIETPLLCFDLTTVSTRGT